MNFIRPRGSNYFQMKRFICVALLLLSLAFVACNKAKGPADGKSIQLNNNLDSLVSMTALINGNNWQTDSAFAYRVHNSGNDSASSTIFVTATQKANGLSTITFNVSKFTGPGTYDINPPWNTAAYYVGNARHFATSGSLVVTDTSHFSLIANFNFVADSIEVQGKFNVAMP